MTDEARHPDPEDTGTHEAAEHPEQEHPAHEAHGGSMAPGLVDDTGHPTDRTELPGESRGQLG